MSEAINEFLEASNLGSFGAFFLVLAFMFVVVFAYHKLNAHFIITLITIVCIYLLAVALGFIEAWTVILLTIFLFLGIIVFVKGGN